MSHYCLVSCSTANLGEKPYKIFEDITRSLKTYKDLSKIPQKSLKDLVKILQSKILYRALQGSFKIFKDLGKMFEQNL